MIDIDIKTQNKLIHEFVISEEKENGRYRKLTCKVRVDDTSLAWTTFLVYDTPNTDKFYTSATYLSKAIEMYNKLGSNVI